MSALDKFGSKPDTPRPIELAKPSAGKKALLFLAPIVPNPKFGGAAMRVHSHLLALCRYFEVMLVVQSTHPHWTEGDVAQDVRESVRELLFYKIEESREERKWAWIADKLPGGQILHALNATPELCRKFFASGCVEEIATRLHGRRFDAVHVSRLAMLRTLTSALSSLAERPARIIIDLDDIESKTASRRAALAKATLGRQIYVAYLLDAMKFRLLERQLVKLVDTIVLCSSIDRDEFNRRYRTAKSAVVPNTVMDRGASAGLGAPAGRTLLFVGHFRYPPNVEAVMDFIANVLPEMRRLDPEPVILKVVGIGADTFAFDASANPEVEIHADVPDLAPYYKGASIVIAPIRWGGGTRIKIIEAFSYGKPVIATSLGAEGLDVAEGRDILLREDPRQFAKACVTLLRDGGMQARLGQAGRKLYLGKYSPAAVENALVNLYET